MDNNEKKLLLQLILSDIRGDWSCNVDDRVEAALDLAEDLELQVFIDNINDFKDSIAEGDLDGRHFRSSYEHGGYIGFEDEHGLDNNLLNKSKSFISNIYILNNPEYTFDDWEEFNKKEMEQYNQHTIL